MAAVRHVRIENFRGIAKLEWAPREGVNAIIGPGDSGKSTVLEALDLLLGSRRSGLTDADFHFLDTSRPIVIEVTVGDLPKELLSLEVYSRAIRGWCNLMEEVIDEPTNDDEPVLTFRLCVQEDCEPSWCLHSERLAAANLPRDIRPDHRALVSAQRLGTLVAQHLAWGPRSVLARLSDGKTGAGGMLARVNRAARKEFDADAVDLKAGIEAACTVAKEMAVPGAQAAGAALDARAVNVSNGAIALHGTGYVPLRALGTGSSRLVAAGHATEDQLFDSLPADVLSTLIRVADQHHTSEAVNAHLGGQGLNRSTIQAVRAAPDGYRAILAEAAKRGQWFKRIDFGEDVGRIVVGPNIARCTGELRPTVEKLRMWFAAKAHRGDS